MVAITIFSWLRLKMLLFSPIYWPSSVISGAVKSDMTAFQQTSLLTTGSLHVA
jgi:hypothetical protein